MNKVMNVVLCLFVTVPTLAMELEVTPKKKKKEIALFLITPEENQRFASDLADKLGFCKTVTAASMYVSQDNPIYKMTEELSKAFKECNNDVLQLITSQSLAQRINNYQKVCDSNKVIKFCLQQIHNKDGDVNAVRNFVATNRQLSAELWLKALQPHYVCQYLEAVQIQDRINYMKSNKDYPMNEDAVKDFIALLIYKNIFAFQTYKK